MLKKITSRFRIKKKKRKVYLRVRNLIKKKQNKKKKFERRIKI